MKIIVRRNPDIVTILVLGLWVKNKMVSADISIISDDIHTKDTSNILNKTKLKLIG